ncbi:MAG: MATE family efflux transporter [Niameybacter sp.]|uniref:MATE family efflux transporter n=1 Tax=Niameybacter sp. TaxID=2033640 RepID=UPI002FCCA3C8
MIRLIKDMTKDKEFFKLLFTIAIPIMIQNLISSSLNMIDTLMIGRLGEGEIAAVGLANQIFLLIMVGLTGICAGAGVFISQYWGKKDITNIKRMLGLALGVGAVYALAITWVVQSFPTQMIGFFNKEPRILELGTSYIKIVSFSYVLTAITFAYSYGLRCIGRTKLPMAASAVAVVINIIFNAIFIFGFGIVEPMGVAGAALATLLARIVETVIIVGTVYVRKYELAATLKELFSIPKDLVTKASQLMLTITVNELCWGLGTIIYTKAYGHIGSAAVTSIQIVNTITNFFLVVIFAIAAAVLTIVGNAIGEGEIEKAKLYAKRIMILSTGLGLFIALSIAVTAPLVVSCFNVTPEVASVTMNILRINAVIIIPRIYAVVMIVGIFRAGGDTKCSLILEACTMWGIGVPLSFLGVYVFNLQLEFVVMMLVMEEVVKSILCMWRFKSNKWIHNMVEH